MERDRPEWQHFDPDDPTVDLPETVASGASSVVALLVSPGAAADGWGHRAAVGVSRVLAGRRGRLLLVDLDLERPRLHRQLGLEEGEGISDAFLWGASLARIVRPTGDGFLLASAGTVVADPETVLISPRWKDLVEGFTAAGATLLLYLPTEIPGRDAVLEWVDEVIVFCGADEAGSVEWGSVGSPVTAVMGPAEPDEGRSDARVADEVAESHSMTDQRPDEEESGPEGEAAGKAAEPAALSDPEPTEAKVESGGSRRLWIVLVILVLLLAATAAAVLYGLVDIPGVTSLRSDDTRTGPGGGVGVTAVVDASSVERAAFLAFGLPVPRR